MQNERYEGIASRLNTSVETVAEIVSLASNRPIHWSPWWARLVAAGGIVAVTLAATWVIADSPPNPDETVPRQIPYRGVLEENGAPVTATLPMTFDLYDDPVAGVLVWSESQTVSVLDGHFGVDLGDTVPFDENLLNLPMVYLRISVDGNAMGGRQRLLTSPYAHRAGNGVPAGAVMPFAGAVAQTPPGWLPCDGSELSRDDFAALFAAIGTAHGAGDGATTFNVPDFRGRFLRGVAGPSILDPEAASRTEGAPGGNTGNAVGSTQGYSTALPASAFGTNTLGSHQHINAIATTASPWGYAAGPYNGMLGGTGYFATSAGWSSPQGNHAHSVSGGGDVETRPPNTYVNYMIKH